MLASQELGEESAEKRPSVQIGDPFTGKKLIEVSVELVERGLVESLQDCGAAGLASSLSEMAADYGIDVHLDEVPLREEGMEPWEVMISESQERMVAIVRPERLADVQEVCDRWELHHAVVGEVTESGELRALWDDEVVGSIPARFLTEECPRYVVEQEPREPPPELPLVGAPATAEALLELLGSDALRSRAWVYRRYDQLVQSRTVRRPGLDAAVLRLRPSWRGLAVTLDGPGRIAALDPFTGGALAILEAARNVACTGARAARLHGLPQLRQPREARGRLGARRDDRGDGAGLRGARAARRLRQRLALQRHRGPLDPTRPPWSAAWGSCPTSAGCRGAWRAGDAILLARGRARGARGLGVPGSLRRPRRASGRARPRRGGCARATSLAGGAALHARPRLLRRRPGGGARRGGDPFRPRRRARSPRRAGGRSSARAAGRAILALPVAAVDGLPAAEGVRLRRIGTVGGDTLLGVEVGELRRAWEGS